MQVVEKDLREKVQNHIQRYHLKQIDIARETQINHSSLSLWLQGKIKGHEKLTNKIETTMQEWLKNFSQKIPHFKDHMELENQKDDLYPPNTDLLIPISIDTEFEGQRYKDFFCWNISEPQLSPEQFAKMISEENGLPPAIEIEIISTIKKSIQNYKPFSFTQKSSELLRVIEVAIRIDYIHFKDQFEWDINDPNNNPEAFAWSLSEELGLNGEFAARIAHQIREQVQFYQKQVQDKQNAGLITQIEESNKGFKKQTRSLYENIQGYNQYDTQRQIIQPEIITCNNYIRPFSTIQDPNYLQQWEPTIEILEEHEIKKVQKQEERKHRYSKRGR